MTTPPKSISFGILTIPYQALDVIGPLDILQSSLLMLHAPIFSSYPSIADLRATTPTITFHHIGLSLSPVALTASISINPTCTVDDCPPLDYLLIGGPDPYGFTLAEPFADFIKKHVAAGKGLFTTCTGGLAISGTGVLDGKRATTNHQCLELAKETRPQVQWVKEQWVEDGNVWTAGGACAGMDMMAFWVEQEFGKEVAGIGRALLDFDPRNKEGMLESKATHGKGEI